MNFASEFFRENIVFVYFVYGLAFFVLGLAISLENRRSGDSRLGASLWFLAAYGILHGLVEWLEMFTLIRAPAVGPDRSGFLPLLAVVLLALSTAFLVHFGARLIVASTKDLDWLIWAAPALFLIWVSSSAYLHFFGRLEYEEWLTVSSIVARYVIYLPGSILAAVALTLQARIFEQLKLPPIARDCRWAAVAFGFNAAVAGLVVPVGPILPASLVNYDSFLALSGMPPQVFRAASALAVAYFVVSMLRVFEVQQTRQLEKAHQERHRAQKAALEVQRQAQEAAERWGRELEKKVQERTEELELRNRELVAINEVTAGLASSLDLRRVLESTLEKMSERMGVQIGAIYLSDEESGKLALKASRGVAPESLSDCLPAEFLGSVDNRGWGSSSTHEARRGALIGNAEDGAYSCLLVPIGLKENVRGVALLARGGTAEFTSHEVNTITNVCSQIAVAVDRIRLYERVQNLAVVEERDRLAREMHDGLAQVLGYLNLETYTIEELLQAGKMDDAREAFQLHRKIVRDAYADVRESILNLRTSITLPSKPEGGR